MKSAPFVLVLDVGTTAVKVLAFDRQAKVLARVSQDLNKTKPRRGWVEQDPQEFIQVARQLLKKILADGLAVEDCLGLGITNQRETAILWDRETGQPVYPAIVWEDVRMAQWCEVQRPTYGARVRELTGLKLESYFSAPEIVWVLENVPAARALLDQKQLAFGTVDSWLLWNLCQDHPHVTDKTNASRTLLFNLQTQVWDPELLKIFSLEASLLPQVEDSSASFGVLTSNVVGTALPVLAVCGDQQASLFAAQSESSIRPCTKVTFGTGTFILQTLERGCFIHDPFFTTLTPLTDSNRAELGGRTGCALEAKIARGGKEVEVLLNDPPQLEKFLRKLCREVDGYLKLLPQAPTEVLIDGGVSRDGLVVKYLAEISGLPVKPLSIFDGTALGVARLCLGRI